MENELHEMTMNDAKSFMLAGKALFTVENSATGRRFTYKIRRKADGPAFVKVLTGSNNMSDFTFVGTIFIGPNMPSSYKHSPKSRIGRDALSVQAFDWLWNRLLNSKPLPETVHVYHHNYCCKCGHLLTTPESIIRGMGPECAGKVS